jgi:hypothetical protein
MGAIINTEHASTLQAAYVLNGSQHSTVVYKVPFDSHHCSCVQKLLVLCCITLVWFPHDGPL